MYSRAVADLSSLQQRAKLCRQLDRRMLEDFMLSAGRRWARDECRRFDAETAARELKALQCECTRLSADLKAEISDEARKLRPGGAPAPAPEIELEAKTLGWMIDVGIAGSVGVGVGTIGTGAQLFTVGTAGYGAAVALSTAGLAVGVAAIVVLAVLALSDESVQRNIEHWFDAGIRWASRKWQQVAN